MSDKIIDIGSRYNTYKEKANLLRKEGLSYSEIADAIPVSKSTLSLWLRDISLLPSQLKRLKQKSVANQKLGSQTIKKARLEKTNKLIISARNDIPKISNHNLWLMGIMLYWAEGSKQKRHNIGQRVIFHNSDKLMIKLYLKWLLDCLKIKRANIDFEIYSHDNIKYKEDEVVNYWSKATGFNTKSFDKIYYKKDKKNEYRKNQEDGYYGLLRVIVLKSTDLNRTIQGWVEGVCNQCRIFES